jgi:hypothetical protein
MSGYRSFARDYAAGIAAEGTHKNELETFFGTGLVKDTNRLSAFDFHNEAKTLFVELKTRNISHDRWPTALIGASKVEHAKRGLKEDPTKRYYFVWIYRDGIYYLPYEEELWSAFETGEFQRNERADRTEVPCATTFIPHQALLRYEGPITQ